jgi:hypothetical protein
MPNRPWITIELDLREKMYISEHVPPGVFESKVMHYKAIGNARRMYWEIFIRKKSKVNRLIKKMKHEKGTDL